MTKSPPARLFAASRPDLAEHRCRFGDLPEAIGPVLVSMLDQAGLAGRGGAGFLTGRKIAAVSGARPVVVGNGAEGEPLSRKDATLLARAPHLVLDGMAAASAAVGARRAYLYLPRRAMASVQCALGERDGDPRIELVEAPDAFVAGEESAVVRRIEGGQALPRDRVVLTAVSGVRGRPTLVNNIETLAHIALIARYGPRWFREVGEPGEPGTRLVTLSGFPGPARVVEVPTGLALAELVDPRSVRAVLVGGYHGSWLPATALPQLGLSRASLSRVGASPGAGILHVLPAGACGLARTAEIVGYLAEQGARQCGPCANGLPRLAELMSELAYARPDSAVVGEIRRVAGLVEGRGSCRHPDGTARLVRSALETFGRDVVLHREDRCEAVRAGRTKASAR